MSPGVVSSGASALRANRCVARLNTVYRCSGGAPRRGLFATAETGIEPTLGSEQCASFVLDGDLGLGETPRLIARQITTRERCEPKRPVVRRRLLCRLVAATGTPASRWLRLGCRLCASWLSPALYPPRGSHRSESTSDGSTLPFSDSPQRYVPFVACRTSRTGSGSTVRR